MVNNQLWLRTCQFPRDGIKEGADAKDCEITLFSGLDRKKPYEKVSLICIAKPHCVCQF